MDVDWMVVIRYGFVVAAVLYLVMNGFMTVEIALAAIAGILFPTTQTKAVLFKPKVAKK